MIKFLIEHYFSIGLITSIWFTVFTWMFWKYHKFSWKESDTRDFLIAIVGCFIPVANVGFFVVTITIMIGTVGKLCIDFVLSKKLLNSSFIKKITKFINNRVLHNVD